MTMFWNRSVTKALPRARELPALRKEGFWRLSGDILLGSAVMAAFSWAFYRSFLPLVGLPVFLAVFVMIRKKTHERAGKARLRAQFRDFSAAFANALRAGLSVPNAMAAGLTETAAVWGEDAAFGTCFAELARPGALNRPAPVLFSEAAERTGVEEILLFAEVLADCDRTGADLIRIATETAADLGRQLDLVREREAELSASRLQVHIMCAAPLLVLVYLQTAMPDLSEGLYGNARGILFMTAALALYVTAAWRAYALLGRVA